MLHGGAQKAEGSSERVKLWLSVNSDRDRKFAAAQLRSKRVNDLPRQVL